MESETIEFTKQVLIRIKWLNSKVCGIAGKPLTLSAIGGLTNNLIPNQWSLS